MPALPAPGAGAGDIARSLPGSVDTAVAEGTAAPGTSIWQWLTFILAATWILTLVYILKQRKAGPPAAGQGRNGRLAEAVKNIRRACRDNDPQQAKTALLQWAGTDPSGLPANSLGDLEQRSGGELAAEVRNLSRVLYARSSEPWRGEPLWQAFVKESRTSGTDTSGTPRSLNRCRL